MSAVLLSKGHDVELVDSNTEILAGTSANNQLRLHQGTHYLRSLKTRAEAADGYTKFIKQYPKLSKSIKNNYYAVPILDSALDYGTALQILEKSNIPVRPLKLKRSSWLKNVEGGFISNERLIDIEAAKKHFNKELSSVLKLNVSIKADDLDQIKKSYDFVIDTTYGSLLFEGGSENLFEATLLLKMKLKPGRRLPFGALTLIDGPFWSIFPTKDRSTYSVSHVNHSVLFQSQTEFEVLDYIEKVDLSSKEVKNKIDQVKEDITRFFPEAFDICTAPEPMLLAKKIKPIGASSPRNVLLSKQGNFIHVRAGKIDAIFSAETALLQAMEIDID